MGRCKPLGSLSSFFSQAAQLSGAKSYFCVHLWDWQVAVSCIPSVSQQGGREAGEGGWWLPLLDHSFGSPHSHLEARNY